MLAYPRLAGLDSEYLIDQLNAFAEGSRDNEAMVSDRQGAYP